MIPLVLQMSVTDPVSSLECWPSITTVLNTLAKHSTHVFPFHVDAAHTNTSGAPSACASSTIFPDMYTPPLTVLPLAVDLDQFARTCNTLLVRDPRAFFNKHTAMKTRCPTTGQLQNTTMHLFDRNDSGSPDSLSVAYSSEVPSSVSPSCNSGHAVTCQDTPLNTVSRSMTSFSSAKTRPTTNLSEIAVVHDLSGEMNDTESDSAAVTDVKGLSEHIETEPIGAWSESCCEFLVFIFKFMFKFFSEYYSHTPNRYFHVS